MTLRFHRQVHEGWDSIRYTDHTMRCEWSPQVYYT